MFGARPMPSAMRLNSSAVSPWSPASLSVGAVVICSSAMLPFRSLRHCRFVNAFGQSCDDRAEDSQTVLAADRGFDGVLRMGHQPEDIAFAVADAGDVVQRAVGIGFLG